MSLTPEDRTRLNKLKNDLNQIIHDHLLKTDDLDDIADHLTSYQYSSIAHAGAHQSLQRLLDILSYEDLTNA